MERMPSIFNDVLSPVTPGPSSSNTCGPYRIARLARALLGEMPRHITVRMARRGGYYLCELDAPPPDRTCYLLQDSVNSSPPCEAFLEIFRQTLRANPDLEALV